MILKTIIVIAILIAGVLIFAASKPATFHIQRSIAIQASPDKVFPLINNLHNWPYWAPQDREDATTRRTFSGPESGVGAVSDWIGSGSTGQGRMSIIESVPANRVTIKVDFEKPFVAENINEFVIEPDGQSTTVTWSMHGPNLYIMKLMSVFTNMDKVMGKHFETGLENLKAAAER